MARLKMKLVTLFLFLLWVALVVAQTSDIDSTERWNHLTSVHKQPPVTSPKLGAYTSQGCFSHLPENITFSHLNSNSPQMCYQECQQRGKNVMLLKGERCYCADNYPATIFVLPDDNCRLGCRSDPQVACGGLRAFSVYNMGQDLDISPDTFRTKQLPVQPPVLDRYISQGCFSELPSQFTFFRHTNTAPNWCYRQCKGRQYSVMLMNDDKCYCADKYPPERSLLPEEQCILPCSGKHHWVCGGPGAYSVYNLGIKLDVEHEPLPPPRFQGTVAVTEQQPKRLATSDQLVSQGCFKQLPKGAVRTPLRVRSTKDFLKACTNLCRIRSKTVAMIHGSECRCATTYPPKTALVNGYFCGIPCRGSPGHTCGGRSNMYTAYLTGLSQKIQYQVGPANRPARQIPFAEPIAGRMTSHGCYSLSPRQAVRRTRARESINTAATCAKTCTHLGKPVALTREYKCICSDTYPMLSTRVDDKWCDVPCPGYPSQACGGHGTWSVINTGLRVAVADDEEEAKEPESPKLPFYGCFDDTPASFKTVDHRSFNRETQGDSCTYACAANGYPVALRQGGDCHCSRSYPPPSSRVNETQCRFECPLDAREMCGGPLVYNVYRTRLDWPADDDLEDPSTSAVTRPWKCSHPVIQQAKKTASWVMSEAMVIVYRIEWALYVVFWEVKRLVINIVSPLRWIWDGISEVMDL